MENLLKLAFALGAKKAETDVKKKYQELLKQRQGASQVGWKEQSQPPKKLSA